MIGVLSRLPSREGLKKQMRRKRRQNLPPNPTSLNDFNDLPEKYQRTLTDDRFLIHDSGRSETGHVIVFATKKILNC